jgi:hypothetical protein
VNPQLSIVFSKGNQIHYAYHANATHTAVGLPHDVKFHIANITQTGIILKAPGFGGEPYGAGAIIVPFKALEVKK